MLSIIILIILTLLLYFWLQSFWRKRFVLEKNNYEKAKSEHSKLNADYSLIQGENARLKHDLEETLTLYDITKGIAKFLDADRVFSSFNEKINKYLEVKDCKFLKSDADLSKYGDYLILPLTIARKPIGYLVASGIKERDKEKFGILAQQFVLGIKRAILYQNVQELATMDSLTGIFTRRYWFERCNEEMERSRKFNYELSFLMLDIDHFKDFNDKYGHLVGDVILMAVSNTIKENIRQIDLVGKYGGEEFCVILTETNAEGAQFVAERIRKAMEEKSVAAYDEDLKVTISIGVSAFPQDSSDLNTLVDKADQALYKAKESGRNRVCVYNSS
jgi:diguanylate cyclase (GGDEF)-like protein